MIKHYLKTAVRSILKHKLYSLINILGLAIGMAICILVYVFVQHETSYEKSYENYEDIHRLTGIFLEEGREEWLAVTPFPLAQLVASELPEVVAATKIASAWKETLIKQGNNHIYTDRYARVDTSFFDVFSFDFISGNPQTVMQSPNNIILTENAVVQFFGKEDPMGKELDFDNRKTYTVAGIIKQPEHPSHIDFDLYIPWYPREIDNSEWVSMFNYHSYAKFVPGTNIEAFTNKMNDLYYSRIASIMPGQSDEEEIGIRMGTQPIKDIHLKSHLDGELSANSHSFYLYIYSLVAIIMLLVAAINFMNIATARSANRAKEVGVRKVIGATRWNNSTQFLIESFLQSFIALVLAFIIAELLLPIFNQILGLDLNIFRTGWVTIIPLSILFTLFTGLLAGSYPALFLSSFKPIKVLKGDFSRSKESAPLRRGLVIFQFVVCSSLILFLFIVANQISYMSNKELGFQPDQVLVIPIQTKELADNFAPLKNQLAQIPKVEVISLANRLPGEQMGGNRYQVGEKDAILDFNRVDENFMEVLDLNLVDGRFFTTQDQNDTIPSYIVNESFVKFFEIENDPVGQLVRGGNGDGHIIGVVKDFHWQGFNESIKPFVIQELNTYLPKVAIRVNPENISQTIQSINAQWTQFEPNHPMRFSFLDDDFSHLFESYENFGKALSFITLLIVFTAILGLFGLSAFMAEQRTKEIGIRKVLGASVSQIMYLIVSDFVRLVLIASLIAIPVGYWISSKWLQEFAYQLQLGVTPFLLSVIVILIISVTTVSVQAFLASTANPIKAIKNE